MHTLLYTFLKGLAFGATMAAIPGPILFLIIQRTLAEGALIGAFCSLGAVTAEALYATVAAIGFSYLMQFLIGYQYIFTGIGGAFLIYLGITTYARTLVFQTVRVQGKGLAAAWSSTFLLLLTNPVTIISYSMIFAGLGIDGQSAAGSTIAALVIGVILGAASLVGSLILFLHFCRKRLSVATLNLVNKIAGILLIGFGIAALLRTLNVV